MPIIDKLGIDDPVGASATHGKKLCFFKNLFKIHCNILRGGTTPNFDPLKYYKLSKEVIFFFFLHNLGSKNLQGDQEKKILIS